MLALLAQADAEKAAAETAAVAAHASTAAWTAAEQQQPRSAGDEEQLQAQLQVRRASGQRRSVSMACILNITPLLAAPSHHNTRCGALLALVFCRLRGCGAFKQKRTCETWWR